MNGLLEDLRYGVRMLFRSPGLSAAALVALGLGIGANTAIFSVVDAILLRPLPYPEPDRLMAVYQTWTHTPDDHDVLSKDDVVELRETLAGAPGGRAPLLDIAAY